MSRESSSGNSTMPRDMRGFFKDIFEMGSYVILHLIEEKLILRIYEATFNYSRYRGGCGRDCGFGRAMASQKRADFK